MALNLRCLVALSGRPLIKDPRLLVAAPAAPLSSLAVLRRPLILRPRLAAVHEEVVPACVSSSFATGDDRARESKLKMPAVRFKALVRSTKHHVAETA